MRNATTHGPRRPAYSADRPAWLPRHWHEWLFWLAAFTLLTWIIASDDGSLVDRLRHNVFVIGLYAAVLVVWVARADRFRDAESHERGTVYKSWWAPRSFKVRALAAAAIALIALLVASGGGSADEAIRGAAAFLALMALSAWVGSTGNYVELRLEGFDVNRVAGAGPHLAHGGLAIPYTDVGRLRIKKNGDFEVAYLDRVRRDRVKRASFKIVPERRQDFLKDLRARVETARGDVLEVAVDRKPR